MPIRDHFHPPLNSQVAWEEMHSTWIVHLMRSLNRRWLPPEYRATPEKYFGTGLQVDVGVIREPQATAYDSEGRETEPAVFSAPAPDATVPNLLAPEIRMLVRNPDGRLVAAIELVSPANKDRPETRDAFAARIQNYLNTGIALVVVDIVTQRRHNLHNRWAELFGSGETPRLPEEKPLYVTAYRPYIERAQDRDEPKADLWLRPLAVGDELPTLPLFIDVDLAVPVELELTYAETCADVRLPEAA